MKILTFFCVSLLYLFSNTAQAFSSELETEVSGTGALKCKAYLRLPAKTTLPFTTFPLVVEQKGTGIYTTHDLSGPVLYPLVREGRAALLTIDKPGISSVFGAEMRIDREVYLQHTQRDLVECLNHAIDWASQNQHVGMAGDLYFFGHSEGTQVLSRLFLKFLNDQSSKVARVKMIQFSGLILNPWKEILDYQLKKDTTLHRIEFWRAVETKNDTRLMELSELGHVYFDDIFATPSNLETLKEIAARSPSVQFQVYQGLKDERTDVLPVEEFEEANENSRKRGFRYLKLKARYYQSIHALSATAKADLLYTLFSYLSN